MTSNIYLYDFNGSVQRNKLQEAMLRDMNQKDEFMKRVIESRTERQLLSQQKKAAIKIQAFYRGYRTRKRFYALLRNAFDAAGRSVSEEALLAQIGRLAFFFRPSDDILRVLSLCGEVVSQRPSFSRSMCAPRRRQLLRCAVGTLPRCARGVQYFPALRCLELLLVDEVHCALTLGTNYFAAIIALYANQFDLPQPLRVQEILPPRAESILRFLLLPIRVAPSHRGQLICELLSSLCARSFEAAVVCGVAPFLAREVRSGAFALPWILAALVGPEGRVLLNSVDTSRAPLFAHNFATLVSEAPLNALSEEEKGALLRIFADAVLLISPAWTPAASTSAHAEDTDDEDELADERLHSAQCEAEIPGTMAFYVEGVACSLAGGALRDAFLECALGSESGCASLSSLAYFLRVRAAPSFASLLNALAAHREFVPRLWLYIVRLSNRSVFGSPRTLLSVLQNGECLAEGDERLLIPSLSLFVTLFSSILQTVDDDDFSTGGTPTSMVPFSLQRIREIATHFRDLTLGLIDLAFPVATTTFPAMPASSKSSLINEKWSDLFKCVVSLTKVLRERDCRLHYMYDGFWSDHNRQVVMHPSFWSLRQRRRGVRRRPFEFVRLLLREGEEDGDEEPPSAVELRNISILRTIPFVIPFMQRVEMFNELVMRDKTNIGADVHRDAIHLTVRRNTIYEDSFSGLSAMHDLRRPIRVQMVNWVGLDEVGVDGGGIFREFLSELLQTALDPTRGFFATTHDHLLYPNPLAPFLYPNVCEDHFFFIGRIIAKLIYEGLLADLRFADFFVSQWLGTSGDSLLDLEYVRSYDPLVHSNLKYLKYCSPSEVDSLDLDFSVLIDNLGTTQKFDLKRNGSEIRVTAENRAEYIALYVNFFLSKRLSPMIGSLRAGVRSVIDPDWLRMFSSSEISILIGGVDAEIDFGDLKKFTAVHNIKSEHDQQYIEAFWLLVNELSRSDKKKLLKFITGCSRPPLMGFRALTPPMGIQLVHDVDKLPTAATCMNLLKLPLYADMDTLRQKLIYAINAGAGFELS